MAADKKAPQRDRLGRRSRTTPQSSGKRIRVQPADLAWLEMLHAHGPLPSSFLLASTAAQRRSAKRATERLTDLFNEVETPDGGRYLDRPAQQFRTLDSRYNQLVYDLAPAGRHVLTERGLGVPGTNCAGPWVHKLMVACTTASVALATTKHPALTYISGREILARADTDLEATVPITDPATRRRTLVALRPDALFGLRYHTAGGDRFRFFVVECDRATEPAVSTDWTRKSWRRNLSQYRAYVEDRHYREHLKLTAPLFVLNVTTSATRAALLRDVTAHSLDRPSYQLFQSWTDFGPIWRPPQPNPALLTHPWHRAGLPSVQIDQL